MKRPVYKEYDNLCNFLKDFREFLRKKALDQEQYRSGKKKDRLMPSQFTQREIAELCGYNTPQYLSNVERGRCLPSPSFALKLAQLYGIETQALYYLFLQHRKKEYSAAFGVEISCDHDECV